MIFSNPIQLEVQNEQLFQKIYFRNNRESGLKSIRCFPYCGVHGAPHVENGFCGQPIVVKVCTLIDRLNNTIDDQLDLSNAIFVAEFKLLDEALKVISPISEADLQSSYGIETGSLRNKIPGRIRTKVVVPTNDGGRIQSLLVVFNKERKPYHYGWECHGLQGTSLKHVLAITAYYPLPSTSGDDSERLLQQICIGTSPPFQIGSVRRKEARLSRMEQQGRETALNESYLKFTSDFKRLSSEMCEENDSVESKPKKLSYAHGRSKSFSFASQSPIMRENYNDSCSSVPLQLQYQQQHQQHQQQPYIDCKPCAMVSPKNILFNVYPPTRQPQPPLLSRRASFDLLIGRTASNKGPPLTLGTMKTPVNMHMHTNTITMGFKSEDVIPIDVNNIQTPSIKLRHDTTSSSSPYIGRICDSSSGCVNTNTTTTTNTKPVSAELVHMLNDFGSKTVIQNNELSPVARHFDLFKRKSIFLEGDVPLEKIKNESLDEDDSYIDVLMNIDLLKDQR